MDGCFKGWARLTAGYSTAGQCKAAAVAKQMSQPHSRNVPSADRATMHGGFNAYVNIVHP